MNEFRGKCAFEVLLLFSELAEKKSRLCFFKAPYPL